MVKKCIIRKCQSKYDGKKRSSGISFYKIQHQRRNEEQNCRISAIKELDPAIVIENDTLICSLHWPINTLTTPYHGRERLVDPHSIFLQSHLLRHHEQNDVPIRMPPVYDFE